MEGENNGIHRLVQMVEEAQDLTTRISGLSDEMTSYRWSDKDRADFAAQVRYMRGYLRVLVVRIAKLSNGLAGWPETEEMPK